MHGLVVRNTGSHYVCRPDDGGPDVACRVKGNFRLRGIRTTNPVAVGDYVTVDDSGADVAYITAIDPRRNYIIRRASNLSKQAHILAANLDGVCIVVTVAHPTTSTTFIDRCLATAEAYRVPATIVVGKTDLYDADEARYATMLARLYRTIGYEVHLVSVVTGEGLDDIRAALDGRVTLLAGHSGVGKSSLVKALVPGVDVRIGAISDAHDQGLHTTTFSAMYDLPGGGYLVDTPGVKGFGTIEFSREEASHYFPEIFRAAQGCRFSNCTHTHEPGCAVLEAVGQHRISESRYTSYLSILDDESEGKYRESQ